MVCILVLVVEDWANCVGDCAELFDYCNQDMIEAKVKLLLQMSLVLIWGMRFLLYVRTVTNLNRRQ